ncbi:putative membrane protein, partial [Vibrio parahaemolyticus AQ3810]
SFCVYWSLFLTLHLIKCAFHVRSGGTRCEVFAVSLSFTVSNFRATSLVLFLWR